jgi:hypothetical protein
MGAEEHAAIAIDRSAGVAIRYAHDGLTRSLFQAFLCAQHSADNNSSGPICVRAVFKL